MKPSRYNRIVPVGGEQCLVWNGLSGALALVDQAGCRDILGYESGSGRLGSPAEWANPQTSPDVGPASPGDLAEVGFLVENDVDEFEVYRHLWYAAQHDTSTLSLLICPTMACDMNCAYCFEDRSGVAMTAQVADNVVELAATRLRTAGNLNVVWFGGEPLLGLDRLSELSGKLIGAAAETGCEYHAAMFTNGYNLGPDEISALAEARVTEIIIPLDGPAEVHEGRRPHVRGLPTFGRILSNAAAAAEVSEVTFQCTIDQENEEAAWELYDLLEREGFLTRALFRPARVNCDLVFQTRRPGGLFSVQDYDRKMIAAYRARLGRPRLVPPFPVLHLGCTYQRHSCFAIDAAGRIYKCMKAVGRPQWATGTVARPPTLASPDLAPWLRVDPFRRETCRACDLLPACGGGCAMAYLERGKSLCSHLRTTLDDWLLLYAVSQGYLEEDHARSALSR
jgi:uncharacterized protein